MSPAACNAMEEALMTKDDTHQEVQIKQTTESLMELFDAQIQGLNATVRSHWQQMLDAHTDADEMAIEKLEIEEKHEKEIADYKTLIQNLEKTIEQLKEKLRIAEEGIKERDEKLKAISSSVASVGPASR
jgi:chromosome segregation ATPase